MAHKYVAVFRASGVPMRLGLSTAPGTQGIVPAPAGFYRFYSPSLGVIVYQYQPGAFVPVHVPEEESQPQLQASRSLSFWQQMAVSTGLTGSALVIYLIVSEGSRILFPPRNLIPVP